MKKKMVAVVLVLAMAIGLTACQGGGKEAETTAKTEDTKSVRREQTGIHRVICRISFIFKYPH